MRDVVAGKLPRRFVQVDVVRGTDYGDGDRRRRRTYSAAGVPKSADDKNRYTTIPKSSTSFFELVASPLR